MKTASYRAHMMQKIRSKMQKTSQVLLHSWKIQSQMRSEPQKALVVQKDLMRIKGTAPLWGYLLKEDFLGGRGYRKTDTKKKARRNKRLTSFITRSKEVSPKNTMSPHVPLCSLKLKSGLRLQFPSLKFRYLLLDWLLRCSSICHARTISFQLKASSIRGS